MDSVANTDRLRADSTRMSNEIADLNNRIIKLNAEITDLKNQKTNNLARINELTDQSRQLQSQVGKLQMDLGDMEAANKSTNTKLTQSQKQIADQQKKLLQLQGLIDQQRKNTEELRKKISDALVDFNSSQLTVSMKNGRVYVSMQESLLFPSGSAEVNPKGKEALSTLAQVLNQNQDINVNVEGHTDSIPITKKYEDNWALSVARSTAISRILINDYHVNPVRITSSGRSQYAPLEGNNTPEGRAHNRRTEIILEPKLDRLMELIRNE
ncbi:MAG: OmpA family protein [Bacteroidota bacterium]